MQGSVDTSFQTLQRDLFASGMAAKIGMNAFGVWLAIKSHSDYNTGKAWPGMRRLAELTGLSLGSVSNSVDVLVNAHLLRVIRRGAGHRGNTYVARERMDVRLGKRVLCTIVIDYVPATLRFTLSKLDKALEAGDSISDVLSQCEIIPGDGFLWDAANGVLRASIPASDMPLPDLTEEQLKAPLVQKILEIQNRSKVQK